MQERIERRIEGMKQAQGNGAPKGRKHLRMDRTAQQYKGLCEGDCERRNHIRIADWQKMGNTWLIPKGSEKSADRRYKDNVGETTKQKEGAVQ